MVSPSPLVPLDASRFASLVCSTDPGQTLQALETLKNEIIGHPDRKRQALQHGAIPVLLKVLQGSSDRAEEKVQAAIVIASLFSNEAFISTSRTNTDALARQEEGRQVVETLLQCISHANATVQLSIPCLRALSVLVTSGIDGSAVYKNHLPALVEILFLAKNTTKASTLQQATYVATFFAAYRHRGAHLSHFEVETIVAALIDITIECTHLGQRYSLLNSPITRLLEASLAAIATLSRNRPRVCTQLAAAGRASQYRCASDDTPMLTTLLKLVKHESNLIRLGGASCLSHLFTSGAIPRKYHKEIALCVLPILIRLFDEPNMKSQASHVLTELVKDSDAMQKAACEAGAIKRVAVILQPSNNSDEDTTEAALLAIAAITLQKDEYRKQVIDAKVVPLIVSAMAHSSSKVRAAACQCARSLSRSVAMLRTSLIDAGVASAIVPLLSDAHPNVKTAATAAICNLVLDFSPMRRSLLEFGILSLLAKLCEDPEPELRLNAVWAIKHIVYAADSDVKESVLHELTPVSLMRLCDDPEMAIQEQACEVVRNLVCGKPENIDLLIEGIGIERLADFLVRKLCSISSQVVVPAVYTLVHIAAGSERHRMILMQRSAILEALQQHLSNESEDIRIGAVWTIINLTWHEDESSQQERRARIEALASLGFSERLKMMEEDNSLDVRERVKTALSQMQ